MNTGLTITEMTLPESADAPDAADLVALVELNNAICLNDSGVADLARTPEEMLVDLRSDEDWAGRVFLARDGGTIIGAAVFGRAVAEPTSADLDLMVLPEHWGLGVEDALLARAEEETRALGRSVLQTWSLHRARAADETISPATGWGVVERTPLAALLLGNGFVLEQVERNSAFDLRGSFAGVHEALAASIAAAGDDYRLVEWTLPTPAEQIEGYAWALSRMSTDAPSGGLEVDEEVWDAARVQRRDARITESGKKMSVAAVEHVPTGRLAAFNELSIGPDPEEATHQFNTLVLKEHRGHRLGMLVKCANLVRWRDVAPRSPRVTTFNAEENRPMLDINEAIGFVPVSYAGVWQKRLS